MKRNRNCFTLVEILMVAGMICLVAALIVVAYNGIYRSWATGNTVAVMKGAHLALDRYMLENGSYPEKTSQAALEDVVAPGSKLALDLLQECAPYSEKDAGGKVRVFDDFGKESAIRYIFPLKNTNSFGLISAGKDGDFGNNDDIIYLPTGNGTLKPGFYTGKLDEGDGSIEDAEPIAQ